MPRRRFQRQLGERRYRKIFFIATEGIKTEPQYFAIFNNQQSLIRVTCLKGKHDSSPLHVLKRMETHIINEGLNQSDEAWLVIDKDNWTEEQLTQLYQWSLSAENYGFALSNPMFEYWLLLHFEEGSGIANANDCTVRLSAYLPGYDKGIDPRKFNREMINDAVRRARRRDNSSGGEVSRSRKPMCSTAPVHPEQWPRTNGSTVYRLIENVIEEK